MNSIADAAELIRKELIETLKSPLHSLRELPTAHDAHEARAEFVVEPSRAKKGPYVDLKDIQRRIRPFLAARHFSHKNPANNKTGHWSKTVQTPGGDHLIRVLLTTIGSAGRTDEIAKFVVLITTS